MRPFKVHPASSTAEASTLLKDLEDATLYAGGTELLLVMKEGFLEYDHLIDIKRIPSLCGITIDRKAEKVTIGSTATHTLIAKHPDIRQTLPLFARIEGTLGNVRVRNSGTIGGNICFAEPHSDIAAVLMLLDARGLVVGGQERWSDLGGLIVGAYEAGLQRGEILDRVEIPIPDPSIGLGYERFKLSERPMAVAGVRLRFPEGSVESATVIVGSCTPIPTIVRAAASLLVGKTPAEVEAASEGVGRVAADAADIISDNEGSEDFKRHIISVLVRRACSGAIDDWQNRRAQNDA